MLLSGSNQVWVIPGVGGGFFNDQNPTIFSVGNQPGPLFVGNFDGRPDLVTVNAGSNDLTLISDFVRADRVTSTISSGGDRTRTRPSASARSSGFDDLVVANSDDGVLALFEGSEQEGLTLTSSETNSDLVGLTALTFSALTGGQIQFYAATAGREVATLVDLSLGGETQPPPPANNLAQLVPLQQSSLAVVGTLLVTMIESPGGSQFEPGRDRDDNRAGVLSGNAGGPGHARARRE